VKSNGVARPALYVDSENRDDSVGGGLSPAPIQTLAELESRFGVGTPKLTF
jgi:hypothetical protein